MNMFDDHDKFCPKRKSKKLPQDCKHCKRLDKARYDEHVSFIMDSISGKMYLLDDDQLKTVKRDITMRIKARKSWEKISKKSLKNRNTS